VYTIQAFNQGSSVIMEANKQFQASAAQNVQMMGGYMQMMMNQQMLMYSQVTATRTHAHTHTHRNTQTHSRRILTGITKTDMDIRWRLPPGHSLPFSLLLHQMSNSRAIPAPA